MTDATHKSDELTHLPEVVGQFAVEGGFQEAQVIESGHINSTYRVECGSGAENRSYVLQRINHHVFKDPRGLMANVARVTEHICQKLMAQGEADLERRVVQVVPTRQGDPLFVDSAGEYWRMYPFVRDAHPVSDSPTPEEIYQAGRGFGEFIAQASDLPASGLVATIPDFHHGPKRFSALQEAATADVAGRRTKAKEELSCVYELEWLLAGPQNLLEEKGIPTRTTHNDTKCNNVLLDNSTNQALCVIDLDTVMPGLALYDLGDLVRTTATGRPEDEPDLSQVVAREELVEQAFGGFLAGAVGQLTEIEIESLSFGPPYMALIMGTRFLTDYLAHDTYYRIHHEHHNLHRARAQLALARSFLDKIDFLKSLCTTD